MDELDDLTIDCLRVCFVHIILDYVFVPSLLFVNPKKTIGK